MIPEDWKAHSCPGIPQAFSVVMGLLRHPALWAEKLPDSVCSTVRQSLLDYLDHVLYVNLINPLLFYILYIHLYVIHTYMFMHVYIDVYVHICLCIYVFSYAYVYVYMYRHICVYLCTCVFIYIYVIYLFCSSRDPWLIQLLRNDSQDGPLASSCTPITPTHTYGSPHIHIYTHTKKK